MLVFYHRRNVESDVYTSIAAFEENVLICFSNSKTFCKGRFPTVLQVKNFYVLSV